MKRFTGLFAAGALALLIAACGGSSKTAAPPSVTPGATPAPAAQPPAAPAATTSTPAPAAGQPAAETGTPAATGRGGGRGTPPPPPPIPPKSMPKPVEPIVSGTAPRPDPRVGLSAGWWNAGQAAWNMRLISATAPSEKSLGENKKYGALDARIPTHSDLAFSGKYAIQGNYNGFEVFDISNPAKPVVVQTYVCPASQNDVSVYKNLIFMSSEAPNSRSDCGFGGVPDPVSKTRVRGIRVFDITDIQKPNLVANVQTCRGSHTHTIVTQPGDNENVYVYVSGTSGVRSAEELPGCQDGGLDDPNSARFRLEVIKVPLAAPQNAAIVSSPRIFNALPVPPRNAERDAISGRGNNAGRAGGAGRDATAATGAAAAGAGAGAGAAGAAAGAAAAPNAAAGRGRGPQGPPTGPNQCHDITVYPEIGLAGGACGGLGLLLDIRDVVNPKRVDFVADPNMSFWHSATFSNDGTKVLFSDEWGGGSAPRCRETDKMEWGADALFTIENNKLKFHSYYKMPAAQTAQENCVAHNGSLIPIPGREVMVQSWYQGGLSVFDWTDIDHPKEIAFFDRGPVSADRLAQGGTWSSYWYNGVIVSSEIARGLDIFELVPSPLISANEIAAAKTVKVGYWNTQDQQKFVWPASFALARAYVDQLERSKALGADVITSTRSALQTAERRSGEQRKTALTELASKISAANASSDQAKVKMLVDAINDLAK
jgi:hypothetical protein